MIEELLPSAAVAVETCVDRTVALYPDEEAIVARAVDKRRREFTTARACAREALERLGLPPVAIPTGPRGEPRWPAGVVGTITHCDGYRACVLGRATELRTVGADAEPNAPLPDGLLPDIALPPERQQLTALRASAPHIAWDRLLFCAKESVYKAWYPLAERWLGFEDAHLTLDPHQGTFQARLLVPGPTVAGSELRGFEGRWLVRDGLLLAAIAVPA